MIASRHPGFAPGDLVHGPSGVQEHAVSDGQNAYKIEVTGRLTAAALSWRAGPDGADGLLPPGMNQHLNIFPTVRAAITGQPRLPGPIFPSATVPARGHRIDGVIAGVATQSAMPAIDLATARA